MTSKFCTALIADHGLEHLRDEIRQYSPKARQRSARRCTTCNTSKQNIKVKSSNK